uniref:Kunitz-type serine protease inhibitor dendrotoxin E n=2 Tax=Dendroaspis TaxID=8617 RepID=VKTE_DENPO|nr:RecName: Full=Kunitz-type serine protease inhibitor dendrotoxin E; Short=DTX-E; AltName: Full=Protein E; AltName: Full=Venom basic protease inhibitor E [Dendroaspis polylepis polylepis]Q7LZE3.2 RecName: Full=Kunitz-type serine protease inhibitor long epsilon-dendrotoxin His55; Contains: RecName: Full=Kunitz-type serine protease inhibitor short epsilon-dendrotoxin His55 [Dendroaspis angusticeps]
LQHRTFCKLPAEPGPCKASIPAFYYNWAAKKCQLFHYGGCKGNANRFSTIEKCRHACVG